MPSDGPMAQTPLRRARSKDNAARLALRIYGHLVPNVDAALAHALGDVDGDRDPDVIELHPSASASQENPRRTIHRTPGLTPIPVNLVSGGVGMCGAVPRAGQRKPPT